MDLPPPPPQPEADATTPARARLSALDRLPLGAWLALVAAVVAGGFWLGLRLERTIVAPVRAAATVAGAESRGSLDGLYVRGADGRRVPLATPGAPLVVMVSSATCAVCEEAMRDFGRAAAGRPLPRLRIVTLEGEPAGAPMLARNGLAQAWHAGPVGGAGQTLLTFQFPGTPTFLFVDADGAVRRALPGYPGFAGMRAWYEVMSGERERL